MRESEWERERESALHVGAGTGPGERIVVHGGSMASSHGRSDMRFADWMASLPQSMHTIPLTNLAIPGRCILYLARSHPSAREIRLEWKRSNYSFTALQTFTFYFYTPCVSHDLKSFFFLIPLYPVWTNGETCCATLEVQLPLSLVRCLKVMNVPVPTWWFRASPCRIPSDQPPSPEAHRLSEPSKDSQQTDEPRCSVLCRTFFFFFWLSHWGGGHRGEERRGDREWDGSSLCSQTCGQSVRRPP